MHAQCRSPDRQRRAAAAAHARGPNRTRAGMTLVVATRYAAGRMSGPPLPRCLVVDDDASMRLLTAIRLEEVGGTVTQVATAEEALQVLADPPDGPFALVVADRRLPGELGGIDVLRAAASADATTSLVLISAQVDAEVQAEAGSVDGLAVDKLDLDPLLAVWSSAVTGG